MVAFDAFKTLEADIVKAFTGFTPTPTIEIGWPSATQIATLSKCATPAAIVSIFDLQPGVNTTRWIMAPKADNMNPTGLTASLPGPYLISAATITLGGTANANDAVGLFAARGKTQGGVTALASATDTPATMAIALASAVNADATLSAWMSAEASGATVTLTNSTSALIRIAAATGNIGTRTIEYHRQMRRAQIDIWANSEATRTAAERILSSELSYLHGNFGLTGPAGDWLRVMYEAGFYIDTDIAKSVYRERFAVNLEFGEDYNDTLYSVLVADLSLGTEEGSLVAQVA